MRTIRLSLLFVLVAAFFGGLLLTEPLQASDAIGNRVQKPRMKSSARQKKNDTFTLALMHYHGKLVKRDEAEAARLLRVAADEGDSRAMFYLGTFYDSGLGITKDHQKAAYWIRKAAARGHAQAQYAYGLLLLSGDGVAIDKVQAMEWLGKAAGNGNKMAAATLRDLVTLKRTHHDSLASQPGPSLNSASIPDAGGMPRLADKGLILDQGAFSLKFSLPDMDAAKLPLTQKTEESLWNRLQGGKFEIIFPLEK